MSNADERNDAAVSLLESGDPAAGERALSDALALDPLHPEAAYNEALLGWRASRIADDEAFRRVSTVHASAGQSARTRPLCEHLRDERGDVGTLTEMSAVAPGGWVLSAKLHPDGERVCAGGQDGVLRIFYARTGACLRELPGHAARINHLAIAPDGRHVLTASYDHTARVWDIDAGQCVAVLRGHAGSVDEIVPTRTGRTVTVSADGTARFWDVAARVCKRTVQVEQAPTSYTALSADGSLLALALGWPRVEIWDLDDGRRTGVLEGHEDYVTALALTPDGRRLVVGSSLGPVRIWDLPSKQLVRELEGHCRAVGAAAVTADGSRALTGDGRGHVRLWDLASGRCLRTFTFSEAAVSTLAFSADERRIVLGGLDGSLRLVRPGEPRRAPFVRSPVRSSGSASAETAAFEAALSRGQSALSGGDIPGALAALREARRAQSLARDPRVRALRAALRPHAEPGELMNAWCERQVKFTPWTPVALSADGEQLFERASVHDVKLDTEAGDLCTAQTADGSLLVIGRADSSVIVRDTATGHEVRRLEWQHRGGVGRVAISADGRVVLSASRDCVAVWDVLSGRLSRVLCEAAPFLAVTADGSFALTGGEDGLVRLWDVRSGEVRWSHRSERACVDVALTPDGHVAASLDRDLRLYDGRTGRLLRVFHDHDGEAQRIALAGDGSRLASAGAGRALVHHLDWDLVPRAASAAPTPRAISLSPLPPAAAPPPPPAWLVEVSEPEGRRHVLGERTSIGRVAGNDVVLPDVTVARRHAFVQHVNGAFWIVDDRSHCGTLVNDQMCDRHPLSPGDVVQIGQVRLRFERD